jgi:hypothetical protein
MHVARVARRSAATLATAPLTALIEVANHNSGGGSVRHFAEPDTALIIRFFSICMCSASCFRLLGRGDKDE